MHARGRGRQERSDPIKPFCLAESGQDVSPVEMWVQHRERKGTRLMAIRVWGLEPAGGTASQSPEKMGEPSANSSGAKPAGWGESTKTEGPLGVTRVKGHKLGAQRPNPILAQRCLKKFKLVANVFKLADFINTYTHTLSKFNVSSF